MKKKLAFFVALFMLVATSASAATFKGGEVYEYKGDTLNDDMYIAGASVDISGNINGDGVVVGGEVSILGRVSQDILSAGGSVRLLGPVGDDVRVAGGNITISDRIGGDLVAAGGFIKILSSSIISGDSVIAGGAIVMNGTVIGDLTVYGDEVTINGPVNGDVMLKFTNKVIIGEDASIAGNLTYSSAEELVIPEGAYIGGEVIRATTPVKDFSFDKKELGKLLGLLFVAKLMLMIVTGVVAILLFKKFSKTVGVQTYDNFWKNLLIGFITLIIVPIVSIILLMSVLGMVIGGFLIGVYILMLFVAKVYAGIVAGAFMAKWIKKEAIVNWKWAILGIVVLQIVSLVPIIGWIVCCAIILATFGTVGILAHKKFWLAR